MPTELNYYVCHDYEVQGPDLEITETFFRSTVDSFLNNESYMTSVWSGVGGYTQVVDFDMNNQKFKVVSNEGWVGLGSKDFYEELEIKMFGDGVCDRAILRTYYKDNHKDNVLSTYIGYEKIDANGNKINISESEEVLRAFQLIQKINPISP